MTTDSRNAARTIWIALCRLVLQGTAAIAFLLTGYFASQIRKDTLVLNLAWVLVGLLAMALPLGLDATIAALEELASQRRAADEGNTPGRAVSK